MEKVLIALFLVALVSSEIVEVFDRQCDIVIIGCGSGGCAAAGELSECGKLNVCIIEAGGDHSDEMYHTNGFYKTFVDPSNDDTNRRFGDKIDYTVDMYSTESASTGYLHKYTSPARLLGGGGAVNGELYSRTSARNFARFNSSKWTWETILPYWKKMVKFTDCYPPLCNTSVHSTTGKINTVALLPDDILNLVAYTIQGELGIPFNTDTQGYNTDGIGIGHRNLEIVNGSAYRQDAYNKLVKPYLSNRTNIDITINALGLYADFDNSTGQHTAYYLKNGVVQKVKAHKALIVSAGAINSAKFLQLSGYGNCTELLAKGINCVIDNPEVGKHLHANVISEMSYATLLPPNVSLGAMITASYNSSITGEAMEVSFVAIENFGFYEIVFELTQLQVNFDGYVKLKDADPLTKPDFSFGFYNNPNDVFGLVEQAYHIEHAINSILVPYGPNITGPLFERAYPLPNVLPIGFSIEDALAYYLYVGAEAGHLMGSTNMHKVVDEDLQCIDKNGNKIKGCYVMDNGIIPTYIDTHCSNSLANTIGTVGGGRLRDQLCQ